MHGSERVDSLGHMSHSGVTTPTQPRLQDIPGEHGPRVGRPTCKLSSAVHAWANLARCLRTSSAWAWPPASC